MKHLLWVLLVPAVLPAAAVAQRGGQLLVLNKEEATLAIVDPASGAVLGRIATGEQPHEVVVSSDGKYAFASNYGTAQAPGHTISMIDVAARKEFRRIDVAPLARPHGLDFAGGKLYFTAEGSQAIARYDPATNSIDWRFETGQQTTHMVLVTRDLKTIFTSNIGSDSVSRIQLGGDGKWAHTTIAVGKGPEGLDLAPGGREVWSAASRGGSITIIDAATGKIVDTFDVGTKRSNRVKLTPDGKFALISDLDAGALVIVDVRGHRINRVPVGKQPEGVLVTPDGSRVFVAVNGDNHVAVLDPITWRVVKTLATGIGPDGMAWVKQ